jgi:predicted molibdopterin-dependent oxidoreductase YjgC
MDQAECVFAIGVNPAASHPISETYLRSAVLNGTKLVVANPYEVNIARYSNVHLRHYPGTEPVLISGILRVLLEKDLVDRALTKEYPAELMELRKAVEPYDLERVAFITRIPYENLIEAASIISDASTLYVVYGLGVVEGPYASDITQALVTLTFIKGGLEGGGGGLLPLYGIGNYQGVLDMGMVSYLLPGQFENNDTPNLTGVLEEIVSGKIKALYLAMENLEGNSLENLQPYLEKLDFVVIQDVVLPEIDADVALPMAAILEKGGTLTNSEQMVQPVQAILPPPEQARSVEWFLEKLAREMGTTDFLDGGTEDVQSKIQNLLSGPEAQHKTNWRPWTPDPFAMPGAEDRPNKDFPLVVVSRERISRYFTGPLLAKESLALFSSNGKVEINPVDGFSLGLKTGEVVRVITRNGEWKGELAMNHHLPTEMAVVPMEVLHTALGKQDVDGKIIAGRIEKIKAE